jgi:spore coat protein H
MPRTWLLVSILVAGLTVAVGAQVRPRPLASPRAGHLDAPQLPALPSDALFNDTILHEVRLDINSKDWQTLKDNYLTNAYYPCDFKWGGQVVRNVGIRSRGNASRSGNKPSLRVDFNRYTANQTLLDLKSVVLRNNSTDDSSMHERISMLLFTRMGQPAPRVAHTRLYVNNIYAGLYTIVESLDKSFLSRNFDENDGYLYKYDRNAGDAPYYLQYLGPNPDLYVPHPFSPETHETDPQPQPLVDLIRTVAEASDANFRTAIARYLDLTKFIRHVAVVVYMGDDDGFVGNWGMNNFDIYQMQHTTAHVLIPWDKSESMHDGPAYSIFHNIDDVPEAQRNRLMSRILGFGDLKNQYLDALLECAASASELVFGDGRGWMEREVDRELAQIQDAVLSDPQKAYTNDQFTAAVEDVRKFARQRADFVRGEVDAARSGQ